MIGDDSMHGGRVGGAGGREGEDVDPTTTTFHCLKEGREWGRRRRSSSSTSMELDEALEEGGEVGGGEATESIFRTPLFHLMHGHCGRSILVLGHGPHSCYYHHTGGSVSGD